MPPASTEGEFEIEEVALGQKVIGARHIDSEHMSEEGEQLFLHDGEELVRPVDFVSRPPGEDFLPDVSQLVTRHVLKRELVAEAESFSLNEEDILLLLVFDVESPAQTEDFLFQNIAHL